MASASSSTDDADWYDELLRAGRAVQPRLPWYRRIFTRSARSSGPDRATRVDRADGRDQPARADRASRRRDRDAEAGPSPRAKAVSSEAGRPGTLSTVMGLVVVSGLAVSVAPGTVDDVRTPQASAAELVAAADVSESVATAVPSPDAGTGATPSGTADAAAPTPEPEDGPDDAAAPATPPDAPTDTSTDTVDRARPWVAVVERLDADATSRQDAVDRSMTLTVLGVATEVVASEDLDLGPGAWLLVTGPFVTADQAVASCADREAATSCEPVRRPG